MEYQGFLGFVPIVFEFSATFFEDCSSASLNTVYFHSLLRHFAIPAIYGDLGLMMTSISKPSIWSVLLCSRCLSGG